MNKLSVNQPSLLNEELEPQKPVECLGLTFENDEARRAYFLEKLREKLQDPTFQPGQAEPTDYVIRSTSCALRSTPPTLHLVVDL